MNNVEFSEYIRTIDDSRKEMVVSFNESQVNEFTAAFSQLHENRDIREDKVNKIVQAYQDGEYIPPILVSLPYRVVTEGNHRYAAFVKAAKLGIPCVIRVCMFKSDITPIEITDKINNTQSKWYAQDRLISQCKRGNENYKKLLSFITTHPVELMTSPHKYNIGAALALMKTEKLRTDSLLTYFNKGTLSIDDDDIERADDILDEISLLRENIASDFCEFRGLYTKYAISTWIDYRKRLPITKWIHNIGKLKKNGDIHEPRNSSKAWKMFFDELRWI